jgi:hypothetical protein
MMQPTTIFCLRKAQTLWSGARLWSSVHRELWHFIQGGAQTKLEVDISKPKVYLSSIKEGLLVNSFWHITWKIQHESEKETK